MFEGFPILDDGRLEEMVGGDQEFILEILQLYLDSSGPDVDALCVAADSGRFEDVLRLAHTIKGASGNIGADAMMEMSRRVELAAKSQDKALVVSETQRTRELYRKTTQVIRERLGS